MSHSQTMQHLQDVQFPNHAASAGCLIPKPCSIRRQYEIGTSVGGKLKNAKVHSGNALNNSGRYFHKQWLEKLIPCAYSLQQPASARNKHTFDGICFLMYVRVRCAYYTVVVHKLLMELNNELKLCSQLKIL